MMLLALAMLGLVCAALPAAMFLVNLRSFRGPRSGRHAEPEPRVSVLIPARDEADGIRAGVQAALDSKDVQVEVLVLDDHSSDATGEIVAAMENRDGRVRCLKSKPLPAGWNGKQHACYQLAHSASFDRLVFLDADVRLQPHALRDLLQYQERSQVALLSAFPHQQTGTLLETWLIPMMHFLLLGFLPVQRMRQHLDPAYAAGCGQLFVTSAEAYAQAGTHAAIRGSRHDGITLPRAYRKAGLMSDVVDGTDLATCRMYQNNGDVVRGLLKNATEGIARPGLIVPFSVILLGGSALPWITLLWAAAESRIGPAVVSVVALAVGHLPRSVAVWRFRQPAWGAACHGAATLLFVALQWVALLNRFAGRQVAWRGRVETEVSG